MHRLFTKIDLQFNDIAVSISTKENAVFKSFRSYKILILHTITLVKCTCYGAWRNFRYIKHKMIIMEIFFCTTGMKCSYGCLDLEIKIFFLFKKNQILKQKPLYLPFATKDIWSSKMFKFLFLILLSLLTIWAPPWKEEYVPIIILRLLILLVAIVAVAVTANKWFICTLIQYYTILFY